LGSTLAAQSLLRRLGRIARRFGADSRSKLALLVRLSSRRFARPRDLHRYHDLLCFLRAYPDDEAVLAEVERQLEGFHERSDLRRHRDLLADSGIAGTPIDFPFHWVTAAWLAKRLPDQLSIDWERYEPRSDFERTLHLLLPYCELNDTEQLRMTPEEWIGRLKGATETDAVFLVRRFLALETDPWARERLFESLDAPMRPEPPARARRRERTLVIARPSPLPTRSPRHLPPEPGGRSEEAAAQRP
jgi:hypothetical protein